jgi:hypothetical protein
MSILQSVSKFLYDRTLAFDTAFKNAKDQVEQGTYTIDLFFTDSATLWSDGIDGLSQIFPSVPLDAVPISYKTVGSASPAIFSEFVNPTSYPSSAVLNATDLIPLTGGTASAAGTAITPQTDGTLKIGTTIKGQKSGELYQIVILYTDTASKVHPVVVLQIRVT